MTVTLPSTGAGTLVLTVAVPAAGTSIDVPITVTQQAITNVTPPVISGQAKVGRTLTATGGTWSVLSPTLAYQWNRDGAPIANATGSTYVVTGADAGADLTVTVTASKSGFGDGSATSALTAIPKADSDTSARLDKLIVSKSGTVKVRIDVDGQYGIQPTGEVTVYDGRKVIATGVVGADGKVTITLPKFDRGIHLISVRYGGNDQLGVSTSFPNVLLVY